MHSGPSLAAFEGYLTDRLRADNINMNDLSDIAACRKLIKAFSGSPNYLSELTSTMEMPPLIPDTQTTITTQSSLTTSTTCAVDSPSDMFGHSLALPEKPPDWLSILDDHVVNANDDGFSMDGCFEGW